MFSKLGLTEEQWDRISELAQSLSPDQALRLSGYFAGMDSRLREVGTRADTTPLKLTDEPIAGAEAAARTITVLFGSETDNSRELAATFGSALREDGLTVSLHDMADYKPRQLRAEQDLLIVTSTHGEGDPPATALDFFEFVEGKKAPQLNGLRYSILALGDSTYEQYCQAGKRLDRRLAQLAATRLHDRVDCDVDYEDAAAEWISTIRRTLSQSQTELGHCGMSLPARTS